MQLRILKVLLAHAGVTVAFAVLMTLSVHQRAESQEPGAGADTDAATSSAIGEIFADIEADSPGCAVGLVRNRSLAYAKGYGLANLDYGLPITPSSNFYLGSVSKQFTAAAVAHAAREGHLSLDDPIQRWLPEIPEYERAITVRHLIHHTSGLRDYLGLWNLSGRRLEDVHSIEETLELIARQKNANFAAGEQYLYSNTGYLLLSVIIERATGDSLRQYMQGHFFGPLGMTSSRFHDDRLNIIEDRAVGYQETEDGYRMAHPWNYDKVGAGGLYSNINDLVHWDRNYYTEEVGGPGFTEQLLERGVLNDGSTIPYAFGLSLGEHRGLRTVSHGGSLAGFRSALLRFPEQETTVLVLCNFPSSDPGSRAERVADVVLADHFEPADDDVAAESAASDTVAEIALTSEQLDAFTGAARDDSELIGDYYSEELDVTYRILEAEGELMLEIPRSSSRRLTPVDEDRFRARSLMIELERGEDGVRGFTVDAGRVRGIYFERETS